MDWLTRLWFYLGIHKRVGYRRHEKAIKDLEDRAQKAMEQWDEKIRMMQFHDS